MTKLDIPISNYVQQLIFNIFLNFIIKIKIVIIMGNNHSSQDYEIGSPTRKNRSFQNGQESQPTFYDLLLSRCCNKNKNMTMEMQQAMNSSVFFGDLVQNQIKNGKNKNLNQMSKIMKSTVACACLCNNCHDLSKLNKLSENFLDMK